MVASSVDDRNPRLSVGLTVGELAAVFLMAGLAGAAVRSAYWRCPAVHDDWLIQWLLGLWSSGRTDAIPTLFAAFSDQVFPLWNLLYSVQLRLFGLDPLGWHLVSHALHSASSALLYAVIVLYLRDRWAGFVAAFLWATAAIGRWDNALLWIGAGVMPLVITLLLSAMTAQRLLFVTRQRRWAIVASASLWIMVATWHITALFLCAVLAQFAWLDRRLATGRTKSWLLALLPAVLWTIGSSIGFRAMGHPPVEVHAAPDVMRMVLERSAQMLSIALANLTFWSAGPVETSELWRKVAMGCAAAASLFFVSSVGRRLVVVIAAPAVILLLALNTRRVEMPADEVLSSGRYYYFPTLAWCALAGAITQSVRARFAGLPVGGIPATLAAAVILGGFAWHQNLVASNALAQFHDLWGTRIAQFQANVALLDRLARSEDGEGIVLPDIPVVVPSVEQHYYPLSVLAEISGSIRPSGGGGKRWEIRQVDSLTPDEIQAAQETFRATGQSLGIEWARTTARFAEDMKAVVWLEARAREQGDIVAVPPISLWYPARNGAEGTSPPLSECVRFGLSTPTPHLAFSRTTENGKRLRSLLAGFDNDEAATWKRWLSGDADSRTP